MSYRDLLRADIQCPWISSERSSVHVQNQVCSSGSSWICKQAHLLGHLLKAYTVFRGSWVSLAAGDWHIPAPAACLPERFLKPSFRLAFLSTWDTWHPGPWPPITSAFKMQSRSSFVNCPGLLYEMSTWEGQVGQAYPTGWGSSPGDSQRSEKGVESGFHCHCPHGKALPEKGSETWEWDSRRKKERLMNILLQEHFRSLSWGWGQF